MNSQVIDIENEGQLERLSKFLDTYNEELQVGKIIGVFPFDRLHNIDTEEKIRKITIILSKLLTSNKLFISNYIEYCFEFVLENWKRFSNQFKPILENLLDYFLNLLTKLHQENIPISTLNVDPQRICIQIHETFKQSTLRKHCLRILIQFVKCFQIEQNKIYDNCIYEAYQHRVTFEVLELCQLGSVLLTNPTMNFKTWPSFNQFRLWILKTCSYNVPFLQIIHDKNTNDEFIKCLSCIYATKSSKDYEITNVYIKHIKFFKSFLTIETHKKHVIVIIKKMLKDLFLQGILPPIDDFCVNHNDFSFVSIYLADIITGRGMDKRDILQLTKEIRIRCYSSDHFHPVTLKAMCYLFPKYLKKQKSTENMILNALIGCKDLEKILTIDMNQLEWILNSDRTPLIYVTIRFWLKQSSQPPEFLIILQKTENVKFLTRIILTDFENETISKRAATLLRLIDNQEVAESLIPHIPSAIANPKCLARLLEAKPAIPENLKMATFFCKVMGTILPIIYETEPFIEACNYSIQLIFRTKNCTEAIEHFTKFETISILTKACVNQNDEISIAGSQILALLPKLEDLLDLKTEYSFEIDFRRVLKGSINRTRRGSILLENLLKSPLEKKKCLELPEDDILAQFLYVQEIPNELGKIFYILTLFLKKYNYLAFSCITPIFVQIQCSNLTDENLINKFLNFLDTLFSILEGEKKILIHRYLVIPCVKKFITKYKPDLLGNKEN